MHGLIVNQLRAFVSEHNGRDAWQTIVDRSGATFEGAIPRIDKTYSDEVVEALIREAAEMTGTPVADLHESFGRFLAPALIRIYSPLLRAEWGTLDVIEHTEQQIHTVVRRRDPNAGPPQLAARRLSPDEVEVRYASSRRMCGVAVGIIRGIAMHFGDSVAVEQTACMLRGDAECIIRVRIVE